MLVGPPTFQWVSTLEFPSSSEILMYLVRSGPKSLALEQMSWPIIVFRVSFNSQELASLAGAKGDEGPVNETKDVGGWGVEEQG